MFYKEAKWIGKEISTLPHIKGVLNIGAGDLSNSNNQTDYIQKFIFLPLIKKGIKIIHQDIRALPGVDIIGEIGNRTIKDKLIKFEYNVVLCCNVMEHIQYPIIFKQDLISLVPPSGFLIITIPMRYPYHPDPIDNGLRLSPKEIKKLFSVLHMVSNKIIETNVREHIETLNNRSLMSEKLFLVAKLLKHIHNVEKRKSLLDFLKWNGHDKYLVSCAIFSNI